MQEEKQKKKGFFQKLREGLGKTRDQISQKVDSVFKAFGKIDDDLYDELEEALILADLGAECAMGIVETLRGRVKENHVTDPAEAKKLLEDIIAEILAEGNSGLNLSGRPAVIMVIGVNGVGKTTTIGKLAQKLTGQGKKVLLCAADTFRAAAIEQLQVWADRTGTALIKHGEGADPAAVIFDACQGAKARGTDVLICDTAGRLHNKVNLMNELQKMYKVIGRELPDSSLEVLLVLDATTGQNAVSQAELFNQAAQITGIVLTKLDGTAKGGIVISIKSNLNIPVKFVGVGEGADDLQEFSPADFARALFDTKEDENAKEEADDEELN